MRSWRTPLIYCISLLGCFLAGIAIDLACGGEVDPYDYYVSFFHNNLQGKKEYRPFYLTTYQFLYDNKETVSEAAINSAEWADYLGKDIKVADVNRAMYKLNSRTDSVLVKPGASLPDSLESNTFLKSLQLKKNASASKYFHFAKSVERLANVGFDRWNPKPLDSIALHYAGNLALKHAAIEKDKFIQLRYYYQAQRLLHYGYNYSEAAGIYDKYIAPHVSQSHVKGWALALKAGEQRHLHDTVHAAYNFSKIFAQYPERRIQAYQNYKYMNVKTPQVLALAQGNNEKAIIYAIEGFGDPHLNLQPLQKVYELEPESPMVGVLLVREVNKLEEGYLTRKLSNNVNTTTKDVPGYLAHLDKLSVFCKQLVTDRKYPDYNIGNLAGAYLAWMKGDNANGFVWLSALNNEKLRPALNDQKQIIQLLLSVQNIQTINEVNEPVLLPSLQWLDEKVKAEARSGLKKDFNFRDDQKFTHTARDFYQKILAPAYLRQSDSTKAALALLKGSDDYLATDFLENQLHPTQVLRLIRWKRTPPATPYLNFLSASLSGLKLNYLNDLLGTTYLRDHQYNKAINAFKQIDQAYYLNKYPSEYERADPFIDRINDYPKVLRYGKTRGLNKLQFAEAMNGLEQQIKNEPKNTAVYYYKMATALYNTSHYGNAWYLISYHWSSNDFGRAEKYSYDADYVKVRNAEKYYLLAQSISKNNELKAKCTFMLAKCKQKQFVMPDYSLPDYTETQKNYLLQLRSNDYFTELKSKYKKTAIYKKAIGECSYLKDFILEK